ncbi:MAG: dehydrogenase E1 component subunit alpha/beta [Planctomycetota bacterium]|nr:dehydrogenase E1 component subunit alpha/beta [Planctomycetota bacterium]
MVTSRELDAVELRLKRQRRVYFQLGSAGHEVIQAAASMLLRPGKDWFYPYYRDRVLALGLGVSPRDMLRQAMAKATDPASGGRMMPYHYGSPELHIVNQSSPTGTQFSEAAGTAEGALLARALPPSDLRPSFLDDELVYVSGGEGSTSAGEFYEAVCAAALKRLPVLFLIQDNEYAISVPTEEQTPGGSISALFSSFPHLCIEDVDGLDFPASYEAIQRAAEHCRRRRGPALVHARVVRLTPHSDSDNDLLYRPASEKEEDALRDPVVLFESYLKSASWATDAELEALRGSVRTDLEQAVEEVAPEPEAEPEQVELHVYNPVQTVEIETTPREEGSPLTVVDAINRTLATEMEADPRIVVFGQDVADVSRLRHLEQVKGKGGVFKVTHGLQRRFGEHRVYNTPIAEGSIVGRALGLAVRGFRPVAEIQFFDYIWPAMHQIRNELSLMRWRSNGAFACPVVLRVPTGGYLRGGAVYHSQSGEAIFCHCPGLRVVIPSNARDAVGLLRTAMRCGDPVLFLEPKHLYRQSYARAPYPGDDYVIPLGKARTVRQGDALTLVVYGALVEKGLRAARELSAEGIEINVIDLRSLQPYDWDAIRESVVATGRLVVAHEESRSFGFGAEIAARAAEDLFDYLDAPVGRYAAKDVHVPYSPDLEDAVLPQVAGLVEVLRRTARR